MSILPTLLFIKYPSYLQDVVYVYVTERYPSYFFHIPFYPNYREKSTARKVVLPVLTSEDYSFDG